MNPRQTKSRDEKKTLIKKYSHIPEINKIKSHKHLPHKVMHSKKLRKVVHDAKKKKDDRKRKFRQKVDNEPIKKKHIVQIDD